jgi:Transposase DDE domain
LQACSSPALAFATHIYVGQCGLVSDIDLPVETIWRTYRGRANCENRIKELKYDFAADNFNMKDFWAIEGALFKFALKT